MASIRKRIGANGTSYHVQIRRKGLKPITQSFTQKSLAQQWARKTESDLERSEYLDLSEAKTTTLSTVLTKYSNEVAIKLKGCSQEQSRCRCMSKRLGDRVLTDITPAVLAEYREERLGQVSAKTVREELSLLQRVFNVCLKDWGISLPGNANPVDLVRKPRGDNPRERRLIPEEYRVISQVPLFAWAIETAMRRGEIAAMDWKQIDLGRRSLAIPVTKNGSSRTIPLSTTATATLTELLRGDEKPSEGPVWEWAADYITREFIRLCQRHGFRDLRFHDLRHEATSRLFEKGLSLMEVASITGHKSLQMLNRYTHLSNDHLLAKLG